MIFRGHLLWMAPSPPPPRFSYTIKIVHGPISRCRVHCRTVLDAIVLAVLNQLSDVGYSIFGRPSFDPIVVEFVICGLITTTFVFVSFTINSVAAMVHVLVGAVVLSRLAIHLVFIRLVISGSVRLQFVSIGCHILLYLFTMSLSISL